MLQIHFFIFGQTQLERVQNLLQGEPVILWIRFRSSHDSLPGSADESRGEGSKSARYYRQANISSRDGRDENYKKNVKVERNASVSVCADRQVFPVLSRCFCTDYPVYTGSWAFIIKVSEEDALDRRYHDDRITKQEQRFSNVDEN